MIHDYDAGRLRDIARTIVDASTDEGKFLLDLADRLPSPHRALEEETPAICVDTLDIFHDLLNNFADPGPNGSDLARQHLVNFLRAFAKEIVASAIEAAVRKEREDLEAQRRTRLYAKDQAGNTDADVTEIIAALASADLPDDLYLRTVCKLLDQTDEIVKLSRTPSKEAES